jgi:hypothetical protein
MGCTLYIILAFFLGYQIRRNEENKEIRKKVDK